MDLSNFKYNEQNLPEDYTEKIKLLETLKEEWKSELKENEALKKYIEKFQGSDFDSLVLYIADRKYHLVGNQNYIISNSEYTPEIRYRKEAERAVEWIQQKKLFNIQCLWRANQFEHPLLRCTYDFSFWARHIHDCPFLDAVSPEDIQLMQTYLRMPNSEPLHFHHFLISFQDYDELLETEGETEDYINMPDWYEFYDGFRGTGYLLKLQDIRGQQEDDLRQALRQEAARKAKENPEPAPQETHDTRPIFYIHDEIDNYFNLFEEDNSFKEINELYRAQLNKTGETIDDELFEALEILKEANEPVFIIGGKEWKDAIKETALRYINKMVADDLDLLYEADALFNELDIDTVKDDLTEEVLKESQFMVDWLKEGALLTGIEPNKYW